MLSARGITQVAKGGNGNRTIPVMATPPIPLGLPRRAAAGGMRSARQAMHVGLRRSTGYAQIAITLVALGAIGVTILLQREA